MKKLAILILILGQLIQLKAQEETPPKWKIGGAAGLDLA